MNEGEIDKHAYNFPALKMFFRSWSEWQNLIKNSYKKTANQWTNVANARDKEFKNGPSKICGRQSLKTSKGYGLLKHTTYLQIF